MAGKAICSVENCNTTVNGHGLCQAHQLRLAKGQPLDTPKRRYRTGTCTVDDCQEPHHARGYCRTHYQRHKRTQGQRVADADRWPRMENVGYHAVHRRLIRDIAPAADLICADCGRPAEEWSYEGGCPDEQRQDVNRTIGMAYCVHQHHYQPRCVPCHKRYDSGQNGIAV